MDSLENDQEELHHQPRVTLAYGSVATSSGGQENRKLAIIWNQIVLILLCFCRFPVCDVL